MPKLRPYTAKLRAAKYVKVLNKHKGNQTAAAKELGITPQSFHDKTIQPAFQESLQKVIDKCLTKAGITTERVYGQLSAQLNAKEGKRKNWSAQDSARKDALKLLGHENKKDDGAIGNELTESLKSADLDKLKKLICLLR